MERMQLLENTYELLTKYTRTEPHRPGIVDLWVFDTLIGLHENDAEDIKDGNPYWIWQTTPDLIMQHIIDTNKWFSLEYGAEQLDEEIREYLIENDFIKDIDELAEEE